VDLLRRRRRLFHAPHRRGRGPVSWWHNAEFRGNDEGYTDDLVTQRALAFIRENKERPFFCYIPFHIAHAPLQAKDEDLAAIDPKQTAELPTASGKTTPENKRIHAAMLHAMDQNVAAIRAELDRNWA
jgi:arylsulfatase A-like enzyme